ncbi:MAG: riboflavin synthase [Gemmatimonadaceae bacterium]
MFTGLVEDVGTIATVTQTAAGRELRVTCRFTDLAVGESIAVNGACLTVRECGPGWFIVAAVVTTLDRSTIGDWHAGRAVNLERALRAGDRLGGHIVQGHVDGVAIVTRAVRRADAVLVDLALPGGLAELTVMHGSIAVDGVSLTVNDLPGGDCVQLSLIDHTLRHTAPDSWREGERVHVEADMIGKYVQRLSAAYGAGAARAS